MRTLTKETEKKIKTRQEKYEKYFTNLHKVSSANKNTSTFSIFDTGETTYRTSSGV